MNKSIPKEFFNLKHADVICGTVGEVIEQLQRLPTELRIEQGFADGVRLVVTNVSTGDPYLCFEEAEDDES